MYFRAVEPSQIGDVIREVSQELRQSGQKIGPGAALYAEKKNGFQCSTCAYVTPVNATHGRCAVVETIVHLEEGCCSLWDADKTQLHLYREPIDLQRLIVKNMV